MILPSGWIGIRPGLLLPVFFLFLLHAAVLGQVNWPETASAALGGSFVCLDGFMLASQNQAGLGSIEQSSVSIQHGRPFCLKELGISSLSAQLKSGNGALGISLSTMGLRGFRQSSLWLSYGQKLHPLICAGLGLHFWNSGKSEQLFYAAGISICLGLQIRINEQWKVGSRLINPASWSSRSDPSGEATMAIESGLKFSFFRVADLYAELHIRSQAPILLCGGAQWTLKRKIKLRTGISSGPFTFTWGICLTFKTCIAEFSSWYRTDTGLSPQSALTYVW